MKKLLLAGAAIGALVASPAFAADLRAPVYKAPPPPVPVWSWTGCYVGGHVGGLWAHKEWNVGPGDSFFGLSDGTHNADGFIGGVQAGCDYQFAGGWVIGVAGDYAWTNAKGSNASILFPGFTNSSRVKNLASVTGRIGYAWDRFLGYVKGGGAWERDDHSFVGTFDGFTTIGTASVNRGGVTVGVGGEYAFTQNLTGFIEYDYYDFGRRDISFVQNNGDPNFIYSIKETKSVLKAGLNFRFGGGKAPVVARY